MFSKLGTLLCWRDSVDLDFDLLTESIGIDGSFDSFGFNSELITMDFCSSLIDSLACCLANNCFACFAFNFWSLSNFAFSSFSFKRVALIWLFNFNW